jgi:lysophospholipase L1-like esterase
MKRIKLAFSLLALVAAVSSAPAAETNKPVDWGALFIMHWNNRVGDFKEQNLAWQNVVLLGDSITEGFEVQKYFSGCRVINRGIGADMIGNAMAAGDPRGVLQRLDNSVFDCAPAAVFILIGINDLNGGHTLDQMTDGYRELLKRIRAKRPDLPVYVQSVLPTRASFAGKNAAIVEFNTRLVALAAEFKCSYLDLHPLLCDAKGELKEDFTKDGLHLTDPAYLIWREQIFKALHWDFSKPAAPAPTASTPH